MKFCTSFAPPPIARPASKTRVLCTLRQCSPVWRYARAQGKFQCAAYSVWCVWNFCFTGHSTIINAARTLLMKACNPAFYSSVLAAFYMTELIWVVVNAFCSGSNAIGSEWDRFPGFSAYQVFASWTHVYECSGCSPMQANACCESKQTTICENRGRRSHSLPDLY